jgi:hypothetical protein
MIQGSKPYIKYDKEGKSKIEFGLLKKFIVLLKTQKRLIYNKEELKRDILRHFTITKLYTILKKNVMDLLFFKDILIYILNPLPYNEFYRTIENYIDNLKYNPEYVFNIENFLKEIKNLIFIIDFLQVHSLIKASIRNDIIIKILRFIRSNLGKIKFDQIYESLKSNDQIKDLIISNKPIHKPITSYTIETYEKEIIRRVEKTIKKEQQSIRKAEQAKQIQRLQAQTTLDIPTRSDIQLKEKTISNSSLEKAYQDMAKWLLDNNYGNRR